MTREIPCGKLSNIDFLLSHGHGRGSLSSWNLWSLQSPMVIDLKTNNGVTIVKIWTVPECLNISIRHLEVQNFRRFSQFSIDFHPEMTVLVTPNWQGKSTNCNNWS